MCCRVYVRWKKKEKKKRREEIIMKRGEKRSFSCIGFLSLKGMTFIILVLLEVVGPRFHEKRQKDK